MIRFIHIKKNGGTSVYKFLRKRGIEVLCGQGTNMTKVYNQHRTAYHYKNEDTVKFCVCRNPYTRIISFYNWTKRMQQYKWTFEEFVKIGFNSGRAIGAWNLQLDYILDIDNNCLVDKILRFETLEEDVKNYFNIDGQFPHLTKSTYDSYENYYTEELKKLVYQRLKKDFKYFNYNKGF